MRSSSSTHRDGALTRRLSGAARLRVNGRPAFRVCGGAGLLAAVAVASAVVALHGGSGLALAVLAASAVATFLAVATVHLLITGEERLVYYHHEIAVLAVAAGVAAALGERVPGSLDAVALGIGAFLVFGRVGCFMVGCCHGRPHRWGVRYGHVHTATGLAPALVGVRLFPVQLAEAALAAVIVAVGLTLVAGGAAPGDAFTWYVGAYAVVRFGLEEARGDAARPHLAGFSQPQWLSLACAGAVAILAATGAVRWQAWDGAVVAIAAGMGLIALRRRSRGHAARARRGVGSPQADPDPARS
jgi:prolipoprotein diacylglyceryltransferase